MQCKLCEQAIEPYDPRWHRLALDEGAHVDICDACAHKLMEWQGRRLARLFPTTPMKKAYGKRRP